MAQQQTNGFDAEALQSCLAAIDQADDDLLQLKSEHMSACTAPRAKIKETMKAAREAGLAMPAFRAVVAAHRAERKVAARLEELEADDRDQFEEMQRALGAFGDTPLGQAALNRVKGRDGDLDSLR